MFTLSAFADEISADPQEQIDVLKSCGVKHIEFRSILKTNVLALNDQQIDDFKSLLNKEGFKISAIGSPVGKVRIDEPFVAHLKLFARAIELCKIFETRNIRIFSYYPPEGFTGDWQPWRNVVLDRLRSQVDMAAIHDIQLFHENEHRIYGDSPERLSDLYSSISSPHFKAAFDPANFVFCGYDPWKGWEASKDHTGHLHIKDWKKGEDHGSLAGEGDGLMELIIGDAFKRGYSGFATLEPHLLGGGPTGGVTGPELFPKAVKSFTNILDRLGAKYQ